MTSRARNLHIPSIQRTNQVNNGDSLSQIVSWRLPKKSPISVFLAVLLAISPSVMESFGQEKSAGLKPYVPQAVPFPTTATYVRPDGSIYLTGNDLVEPLIEKLNDLFIKTHRGFRFSPHMMSSAEALSGITSGK